MNAPHHLKKVAEQIVVTILPQLEDDSKAFAASAEILKDLVVNNKGLVKDELPRFPLLPEYPSLDGVNRTIERERGNISVPQRLELIISSLQHESLAVQSAVLQEVVRLPERHPKEWKRLLDMPNGEVHPVVGRLISCLLR